MGTLIFILIVIACFVVHPILSTLVVVGFIALVIWSFSLPGADTYSWSGEEDEPKEKRKAACRTEEKSKREIKKERQKAYEKGYDDGYWYGYDRSYVKKADKECSNAYRDGYGDGLIDGFDDEDDDV